MCDAGRHRVLAPPSDGEDDDDDEEEEEEEEEEEDEEEEEEEESDLNDTIVQLKLDDDQGVWV